MIDFSKVAEDLYIVYKNGIRVTDVPVSREELVLFIDSLNLTETDQLLIERFYGQLN